MIRKEESKYGEKTVFYIVKDDINVSAIISELSSMGCKGEELGKAYRKLTSENKGYLYKNEEKRETLLVIDESHMNLDFGQNALVPLFFMFALFGGTLGNPYKDFIDELKRDGEKI